MSILIFVAVLFVLVLVHELGHFVVAKWVGMRVDEFGIGFPPRLFGIKKGETLYSINAIPMGGFVKIFGEDSLDENSMLHNDATTRSFISKNKWAQSAVLLAGVTMNVLFAWFLVVVAFSIGVQGVVSEDKATESARLTITHVVPGSPADDVSLGAGAVIRSVQAGDETLTKLTPSAFSAFVASHGSAPLTIAYTTGTELKMVQLNAEAGVITDKPEQPAIGVALAQIDIRERSFTESIVDASKYVVNGLRDITVGLAVLLYNTFRMQADFSQIAGPVGIVGLVGEASAFGFTTLLMFTALISLNLAVINVLPFPALDGGRLLFVIVEAFKGSPISPKFVAILNTVGFFLLIALMVAVTWNDIAKLI